MKCGFEEKQYETLLNGELVESIKDIYVPGQVLEGTIGFDAAVYSKNKLFWKVYNIDPSHAVSMKSGVVIRREWWNELEKTINYFPPLNLNLFIQHKRPEYLNSSRGKEWPLWKREYFRYDLTPHQQLALAQLENNVASKALVVYASPAFYKLEDLWRIQKNGGIVANSNFCTAGNLNGHGRYSYSEPGNKGIAHSDPEEVESIRLDEWLNENRGENEIEDVINTEIIIQLGKAMEESVNGTGSFAVVYGSMCESFLGPNTSEFVKAASRVWSFLFLANVRWYALS